MAARSQIGWSEQRQDLYRFYLDVAAQAYELHEKWRTHQGVRGTRLHSIERESGRIVEVPDGIIFPILASLSAFAIMTQSGWQIKQPRGFDEKEVIAAAAEAYKEMVAMLACPSHSRGGPPFKTEIAARISGSLHGLSRRRERQ
jgi:hypothetical protein